VLLCVCLRQSSAWPLKIRFRRQLTEADVLPLFKILEIEDETLKLHQLKRRLTVVR
jgi:hypothetical protein